MFSSIYNRESTMVKTSFLADCRKRDNGIGNSNEEESAREDILSDIMNGFSRDNLLSRRIKLRGEIGIFQANKIHCGPANDLDINREVIFCVFSGAKHLFSDTYQEFEWNLAAKAFGFASEEHKKSLRIWRDKHPENHEPQWRRQIETLVLTHPDGSENYFTERMKQIYLFVSDDIKKNKMWTTEKELTKEIKKQMNAHQSQE
jgi:hypothetical protein